MRRLAASGLLPERAGQPVRVWAHISLAGLRALDGDSVLEAEWVTEMQIRWTTRCAQTADGSPGDGGAWLTAPPGPPATEDLAPSAPVGSAGLEELSGLSREAIQQAIIAKTANLASELSGLTAAVPRPNAARIGTGGVTGR